MAFQIPMFILNTWSSARQTRWRWCSHFHPLAKIIRKIQIQIFPLTSTTRSNRLHEIKSAHLHLPPPTSTHLHPPPPTSNYIPPPTSNYLRHLHPIPTTWSISPTSSWSSPSVGAQPNVRITYFQIHICAYQLVPKLISQFQRLNLAKLHRGDRAAAISLQTKVSLKRRKQ